MPILCIFNKKFFFDLRLSFLGNQKLRHDFFETKINKKI